MRVTNTYAEALAGLYTPWKGAQFPLPEVLRFNEDLGEELCLPASWSQDPGTASILTGTSPLPGGIPLAQAYAGHQFGHFSASLGDGRALLIGEIVDRRGQRRDLHLKGSGRTPYSRGGDGKAVLGPVLREYLLGEAMHALGVPTTRGLAVLLTGEQIPREEFQPGAVLARVAASHLRVGTFQYFAARGEHDKLRRLTDYTLERHDPDLSNQQDPAIPLLTAVIHRQVALVAKWMSIGFVHGVMNTDNTSISGETIDFGPCAFIDAYAADAVYSSIDHQGRYAFGNQPAILQWNMARFAESLLPLVDESQ
ncbi:MAG TPA: protein adenylyltransferase SelO family protein, partial [Planctomycetota bacterium]|nr:protein adenylyltransferase SelO family protein [Planctomycetota bacterium]